MTIGSMNIEVVFEGGKILFARVIRVRVKFGQMSEDAELTAGSLVGLIRCQNFDGDIMMKSHPLELAVIILIYRLSHESQAYCVSLANQTVANPPVPSLCQIS